MGAAPLPPPTLRGPWTSCALSGSVEQRPHLRPRKSRTCQNLAASGYLSQGHAQPPGAAFPDTSFPWAATVPHRAPRDAERGCGRDGGSAGGALPGSPHRSTSTGTAVQRLQPHHLCREAAGAPGGLGCSEWLLSCPAEPLVSHQNVSGCSLCPFLPFLLSLLDSRALSPGDCLPRWCFHVSIKYPSTPFPAIPLPGRLPEQWASAQLPEQGPHGWQEGGQAWVAREPAVGHCFGAGTTAALSVHREEARMPGKRGVRVHTCVQCCARVSLCAPELWARCACSLAHTCALRASTPLSPEPR